MYYTCLIGGLDKVLVAGEGVAVAHHGRPHGDNVRPGEGQRQLPRHRVQRVLPLEDGVSRLTQHLAAPALYVEATGS